MFERFDNECTTSTPSLPACERGDRRGGRAVGVVGELGVALVAGDDDAPRPGPLDRVEHPLRRGDGTGGVARVVEPEQQRAVGVGGIDAAQVEVPLVVDRHRHRTQARRAARPSRRWGTPPPGTAPCRATGRAATASRGSDATTSLVPMHAITSSVVSGQPKRRSTHPTAASRKRGAPDRGRVAGRTGRRLGQRVEHDVGHGVDRRADRGVDDAAGHRGGGGADRSEAIVRVRRRDEGHRASRLTVAQTRIAQVAATASGAS